MRIIAGTLKGRRLASPAGRRIRPTSDRLRETLFNVLAPRVPQARVLDGFAGTGAVGLEALSRGATHVTFVDADRDAQRLIEDNLTHCGVREGYAIIRATITEAVDRLSSGRFDLILLDPPYDHPQVDLMLAHVGTLLADDGVLVIEHPRRSSMPATPGPLECRRVLVSGSSALSFYGAARAAADRPRLT